jgi:hypothetical protein
LAFVGRELQLDRADQADAADLADQRMVGEARRRPACRCGPTGGYADDVALVVDLQRLDRDGGGDGMAE